MLLSTRSLPRLAKSVCTQLNDRIKMSHENFETLLKQLDHRHSDRLKSTEDKQQRVRKDYTPKIARLLLESTSLKDLIQYGLPKQGRFLAREPQLVELLDALDKAGWSDVDLVGSNVIRNKSVAHRGPTVRALYATATAIDAKEFPEGKVFLESFQKRFGADPVWGAQYAYDAVYALADAARQARSLDASDLVETLKHIEPGTKVNQQMRFAVSGEQVYPSIGVYKVDHGAWAMQMMSAVW